METLSGGSSQLSFVTIGIFLIILVLIIATPFARQKQHRIFLMIAAAVLTGSLFFFLGFGIYRQAEEEHAYQTQVEIIVETNNVFDSGDLPIITAKPWTATPSETPE